MPETLPKELCTNHIAQATILKITDSDFSANMQLRVNVLTDSCGNCHKSSTKMTAWVKGNDYSLREGDIIAFKFNPQRISNNGNPEEFNYAYYMRNRGFLYHQFINQDDYKKIGQESSLIIYAKNVQRDLINHLLSSSLDSETKTFFITIITGESSLLSQELRETFSHAGLSHILALSGLHISIIALLLGIFLYPLDYIRQKRLRYIITLVLIVIYAFITGLSISVIRATVMIGFVMVARIIHRQNNSLNALFTAALLILLISPNAIYDIGFQFSFLSVLSILLLSDKLTAVSPKKELLYYIYSLVMISLITTIATAWLTAFYFNYISLCSLITNILIIPVLPIIVGLGLIYLLLLVFGMDFQLLSRTLNTSYDIITSIAQGLGNTPYSYIDNIYISPAMLAICCLAIISVTVFILTKKRVFAYGFILFCIGICVLHFTEQNRLPKSGYVIFNDNSCTPILTFNDGNSNVWNVDDTLDISAFKRQHRQFLAKYNIESIHTTNNSGKIYTVLGGNKVVVIKDNYFRKHRLSQKADVDLLLITKGYYGTISELLHSFSPSRIALAGNIYYKRREILINECNLSAIEYHDIKQDGAIAEFFNH